MKEQKEERKREQKERNDSESRISAVWSPEGEILRWEAGQSFRVLGVVTRAGC